MNSKVVLKIIIFSIFASILGIIFLRCKKNYEEITFYNDMTVPSLNIKEPIIYTSDDNYNIYDNITCSFGISGGNVSCYGNTNEKNNSIICQAIANNGLTVTKVYNILKSNTYKKSIIFFGDSITVGYGAKNGNYSFVDYIENHYDFKEVVNAGENDYRVSTYQRPNKWLGNEVINHLDDSDYDYVIMQGGVNDALVNTPLGELSSTYDSLLDTDTFYGGLEAYIRYVIGKWENAKIGYIINYYTPNYSEKGNVYSYEHYKEYYDAIKKTLLKYNIPFLDLFEGKIGINSFSNILSVDTDTYLSDDLHLNDEGYNQIAPYIYEWISNLNNYEKLTTKN